MHAHTTGIGTRDKLLHIVRGSGVASQDKLQMTWGAGTQTHAHRTRGWASAAAHLDRRDISVRAERGVQRRLVDIRGQVANVQRIGVAAASHDCANTWGQRPKACCCRHRGKVGASCRR